MQDESESKFLLLFWPPFKILFGADSNIFYSVSLFPIWLHNTQAFTVDQFPDCAPAAVWAPYLGGRGRDWLRAATCRVPAPSTTRGRRSVAPSPRAGTSSHSGQNIGNIVCRKLRTRQVDGCSECVSMFHVSTVTTDQLSPSPPSAV